MIEAGVFQESIFEPVRVRPMPTARGHIHFRMHYVESLERFVIERYCSVEGWFPVYFDDFGSTAYLELKAIAARSFGYVVCAKCKKEIADPQLSPEGVQCEDCKDGSSPVRGLIIGVLISALFVAGFYLLTNAVLGVR